MFTSHRIAFIALAAGGVLWNIYGAAHPKDNNQGTKLEQLHEMLVASGWYPAHLVGLLAYTGFAAGAWALRRRGSASLRRVTRVVWIVAAIQVVAMIPHLMMALNADGIGKGDTNVWYWVAVVNESFVSGAWALAFAVLAVVGGLTRAIGNFVTAALGMVGGGALALFYTTIPFIDLFDPLAPVGGSLLGLWAVVIGLWYAVTKEAPAAAAGIRVATGSSAGS